MPRRCFLLFLLSVVGNADSDYINLASYVRLVGGYVNEGVVMQTSTPRGGLFATSPIAAGQAIFRLPWDAIQHITNHSHGGDPSTRSCELIQHMADTLREEAFRVKRGWPVDIEDSSRASRLSQLKQFYYRFLLTRPEPNMPSAWTPQQQDYLSAILGSGLPPQESELWFGHVLWFTQTCNGSMSDTFERLAMLSFIARSNSVNPEDAGEMLNVAITPLFDCLNHRREGNINLDASVGSDFVVEASRDIANGEELTYSYSGYTKSTTSLFNDYGFVESAENQLWHVPADSTGNAIEFTIQDPKTGGPVEVDLHWITEMSDVEANFTHLTMRHVIDTAIQRLMESEERDAGSQDSGNTGDVESLARDYRDAFLSALQLAQLNV